MRGVSIAICCHNSAERLPTTLAHLIEQRASSTPWELVVVDNASTDATTDIARSSWKDGPAPLRIIYEKRLGVRYARERALREARYSMIGFVDDDNWLASDWIANAYGIISSEPRLGAVGSVREPASEINWPFWFNDFHSSFAVLTEAELLTATHPPSFLPTAGLCIRKSAWMQLVRSGFKFQAPSRVGGNLQGGEDTELTVALRLGGWKLKTDPRLKLTHFMPKARLTWNYLRRLMRASGASDVWLDAYSENSLSMGRDFRSWASDSWWYQLARTQLSLAARLPSLLASVKPESEGLYDVLEVERLYGRTLALLEMRKRYGQTRRLIRQAPWRCLEGASTPIR
jgi:glycosyltransferase involved in cell wall biosynthesis